MRKKAKDATKQQRERWEVIRQLGCMAGFIGYPHECGGRVEINHCETKMGCRKDHDKVIPLCTAHHRGKFGFTVLGKKPWAKKYGSERYLMEILEDIENGKRN